MQILLWSKAIKLHMIVVLVTGTERVDAGVRIRFVFWRESIRILAGTPAILNEAFHWFPQFLQANSGRVLPTR
jgi:hypothetical protein